MVRIRFPPAVNQANFRIAPLAGPLPLGASPGCEERDLKIFNRSEKRCDTQTYATPTKSKSAK